MIKKILLSLAVVGSICMNGPTASAAIQLPDYLRPTNLPAGNTAAEATDEDHPETAATNTIIIYIGGFISQGLLFLGSTAIIFLIFAGGNYIFAFGKDERIERGKRGIFWSLMGLIVILFSYALVQGIISILLQVDSSTG